MISNKYGAKRHGLDAAQMLSLPPFATDFKLFAADQKTTIGDGYRNMLTCMYVYTWKYVYVYPYVSFIH